MAIYIITVPPNRYIRVFVLLKHDYNFEYVITTRLSSHYPVFSYTDGNQKEHFLREGANEILNTARNKTKFEKRDPIRRSKFARKMIQALSENWVGSHIRVR